MDVDNGIDYWEKRFCKFCHNQLCKTTAQARASVLIGQGPAKDYLSCMKGFELAILLGDRNIVKEFRKKGQPPIKTGVEITGENKTVLPVL